MSNTQRGRTARRGYWAASASLTALALGGVLAPAASAATTPPDYTVVESIADGVARVNNATGAASALSAPGAGADGSVAITPDGKTAYVTGADSVTPVDIATGHAGTPIVVGVHAGPIAISPDGSVAYVGNVFAGTVTPVRLSDGVALAPIALSTPLILALAFTPNGKDAYVVGADAATGQHGAVTPIVVATGTALAPIALGGAASTVIRISPDGKTAYVAGLLQPVVFTIHLATNTLGPQIHLVDVATSLAISPDGKMLYAGVSNFRGQANPAAGIYPVTLATGAVGPRIAIPAGVDIADMANTPDGKVLYISNRTEDQHPALAELNEIVPIDLQTRTAGTPIVTDTDAAAGGGIGALAITPDQAPVANATAHATCAVASFDASGSTVRYGTIVRYAWSFGDGKTAVTTTAKTTHTYAKAGTHTVTVTETDSAGTSTKKVFTGQTLSRNGGPSAVGRVTVATTTCGGSSAGGGTVGSAGGNSTSEVTDADASLPRTGAQTTDELMAAALLLVGGAGMVSVARRRRS